MKLGEHASVSPWLFFDLTKGCKALTYSELPPLLSREASLLLPPLGEICGDQAMGRAIDFNSKSDFTID